MRAEVITLIEQPRDHQLSARAARERGGDVEQRAERLVRQPEDEHRTLRRGRGRELERPVLPEDRLPESRSCALGSIPSCSTSTAATLW